MNHKPLLLLPPLREGVPCAAGRVVLVLVLVLVFTRFAVASFWHRRL